MTGSTSRAVNAVSAAELERRWQAARAWMRANDVDALVVQNSSDWVGGYIRWFCNQPATNGYTSALVFPREGGLTLIEQGPFEFAQDIPPSRRVNGIARRLTVPSYPSVGYTGAYDADLVLRELRRLDAKRIGLVAPAAMYFTFGQRLTEQWPADARCDATDAIDRIKAIKSEEERGLIAQVAHMQDEILRQVTPFVRPGRRDFEIAAYAQYVGQQLGSEQGIFLCSSAPQGQAASFRPRSMQGRTLEAGDVFSLLIENNGAGGFYTELSRVFVLGRANARLREAHAAVIEAQRAALAMLRPGARCRDVYREHNAYLRALGLPEERRLSIHGMGYDMVERPLVRDDEDMAIAEHMAIVVHPGILNAELFAHNTDLYLIGAEGPSACLHQTPKQLIELT